jgi:SAM-dependent methyltransferase
MADDFWEHAARQDPLWAILSDPTKRGRRWDLAAFFETGRREISLLLYQLQQFGHLPDIRRALDFGCGVGRLTQALAARFDEVVGVDVSPTMIRLAEQLNRHRGAARYVLNQSPALEQFGTAEFDFVYSDIVLQHLSPEAAARYLTEFLRLLSPGGITVFQLPSHKRTAAEQPPRPVNMPAEAYRANLQVVEGLPRSLRSTESVLLTVEVRNAGPFVWDQTAAGSIRLGNHWRNPQGVMIIQDDGRTALPPVLGPGEPIRVVLSIQAPRESGSFLCEIDLVHEGISWFGDLGSTTLRMPIVVAGPDETNREGAGLAETAEAPEVPQFPDIYATLQQDGAEIPPFPMHGVPRDRVIALVRQHGCEPFFIEDDERGGPEWRGYRYFVAKPK